MRKSKDLFKKSLEHFTQKIRADKGKPKNNFPKQDFNIFRHCISDATHQIFMISASSEEYSLLSKTEPAFLGEKVTALGSSWKTPYFLIRKEVMNIKQNLQY